MVETDQLDAINQNIWQKEKRLIEKLGISDNYVSASPEGKPKKQAKLPHLNYRTIPRWYIYHNAWKMVHSAIASPRLLTIVMIFFVPLSLLIRNTINKWITIFYAIVVMHWSDPDVWSVLWGLSHSLTCLPVLVSEMVTYRVNFCSRAQQCPVVPVGLQVSEG